MVATKIRRPVQNFLGAGQDGRRRGKYAEGMLVRHGAYGQGRIIEVSDHGALRKVKIRFASAGERTFIADKVTLEVLRKG